VSHAAICSDPRPAPLGRTDVPYFAGTDPALISASGSASFDAEARNDAFALEHDINEYYERSSIFIRYIEASRLRCIARMVRARATDRILEVGCGGGHILRLFPDANLTGVDVSGRMLDKARENLRGCRVQLLKGDVSSVGLPDRSFDKIICSEVLEHVVDPHAILREIRRLLAPGGRVVITFPNDRLIHRIKKLLSSTGLDRLLFRGRTAWGGDDYHLHIWSVSEMRALLSRYFTVEEERFAPARFLRVRCCFRCGVDARR